MPTKTLIIISPYRLSQAEAEAIIKGMKIDEPQKIKLENIIDRSILAGVIIKYEDYYLDMSLKNKLHRIDDSLN
jgi:F0F1-type ATP synthase delta subunit